MADQEGSAVEKAPGRPVIAVFTSHWLAMVGLGLVLTSIVLWSCLLTVRLRQGQENPYIGVVAAAVGGVLLLGAILAPIGLFLGRRKLGRKLVAIDRKAAWSRLIMFLVVTAGINVAVISQSAITAVHHLESRQFCVSCHVHDPEDASFSQGPHARILCVDCHVGEGSVGFIKSKLQGTEQLMSILTDSVHVPIETAIERNRMIPSAETCEACHWKERPATAKLRLFQRYADDEQNTPETTLLTMYVGGERAGGIHGSHHAEGIGIKFVATDPNRQNIPWVEYTNAKTGVKRTYVRKGADPASFSALPQVSMQCFDCHNRPAHIFEMPDRAVDRALMLGRMSASLPFLKKASVEILRAEYASSEAAASAIPAALVAYYAKSYPELARTRAADIEEAGRVVAEAYARNVFPVLGVKWGTYANNIGHQDFPGCFRCHDGEHVTPEGEAITNNCFRCHFPSAVGETDPAVLATLGVDTVLSNLKKK